MRQQESFFETPYLSVESSCGSQRRGTKTLFHLYIPLPWETVTLSDVERPKIRLEGVYALEDKCGNRLKTNTTLNEGGQSEVPVKFQGGRNSFVLLS